MLIQRPVLKIKQLHSQRPIPESQRSYEYRHQEKRALGGNPISGVSLGPLTFVTEIAFGASFNSSQYLSQSQNGLTCCGAEKKLSTT